MATQDETPGRGRTRIRNLASAAMNADVTIDQATAIIDGLGDTMQRMDATMSDFDSTLVRMNRDLDEFESLMAAIAATVARTDAAITKVNALLDVPTAALGVAGKAIAGPVDTVGALSRRFLHRD
ncbi:hypothetical protein [Tsukamurella sp. 1534]|uniref:hypothetical protein n=1 Tax=Tsukamurella sp. 1534 TaxID=1151061 RepID=UPI0003084027|nr:hypothetical protein [Tsukamurella sp. 1534]